MVSTSQQIGGAIGLAVLIAVANASRQGNTGEALRTATTNGLRNAILLAAAGIAATMILVLNFKRKADKTPGVAKPDRRITARNAPGRSVWRAG
jgi:hypothetical protein